MVVNDIVIEVGTAIQIKGITVFDLGKIWEEKKTRENKMLIANCI